MTGFQEGGEPSVWLVNVEPSMAQNLSRVAAGLRLKLALANDLKGIPSGAFVVVRCDATGDVQDQVLHALIPRLDMAQSVIWPILAEGVPAHWADRLIQAGVTDVLPLPVSTRMIVHRFRLLLELWQRRRMETRDRTSLRNLSTERDQILSHLEEGLILLDRHGLIVDANTAATDALVCPREQLLGSSVAKVLTAPWVEDPLLEWCDHPLFHPIVNAETVQIEDTHFWRIDGEALSVTCRLAPLETTGAGAGRLLIVFRDITVQKAEEALVDQLTRYDAITGLANAPLMRHFLLKAMARALRNDRLLAVMYIDLDDFTCINETFGRKAGNHLLRSVGRRLRGCIRTGDLVCRYHEDTFIIVLDEMRSPEDAERVAEQMLQRMKTPHDVLGAPIVVHVSIGLALYPSQSIGIDTLLERAAQATGRVKAAGKNNYLCYSESDQTATQRSSSEMH